MVLYMFQVLFMPCVWYFIKVFLNLQKITKATFKTLHSVGLWFLKVTEHIFNILPFPPVIAPESYEYTKQAISECRIFLPYCQLQVVPE